MTIDLSPEQRRRVAAATGRRVERDVGPAARMGRDEEVDELVADWHRRGGSLVFPGDPAWPVGLQDLGPAEPLMLWVRGRLPDLSHGLAVVGSRRCTAYGLRVCTDLAQAAAGSGHVIVSGGAAGIDRAAHEAALNVSRPTVLVAAGGAGWVYPSHHDDVFARIAEQAAVVWEYPRGTEVRRADFLHRNRIIAAMARATLVVEAAERSGALNTARVAADLGRLVLAVPGPVNSDVSRGPHDAICEGWACLVRDSADLLDLVGGVEPAA